MPSKAHHNTMQQSSHTKDHRHHHRSNRSSSSGLPSHNGNNQFQNDNSFQRSVSPPSPISIHYSAYFIDRIDLDDYTEHTLKQTVDNVVSGIKTKGLKVKLIFPDEGLIVDNLIDPNQSWMYKASELLYFWRDPFYINIIVSITSNRSRPSATGPYSASIFRLRGDGLVQVFFQRAQQFFAQFSAPPPPVSTNSNNNNKILIEKSTTVDNLTNNDNQKKKSKHNTMTNKQTSSKSARSLQTTPVRQGARTEFDPARTKTKTRNSIFNLYNNRTNSETTLLNEPRAKSSKRRHNNNNNNNATTNYEGDNKITSISVHLSGEHVAELMRELKELRNEIASLKLEARFTPVRSTSTSPMTLCPENTLHSTNLSTSLPALTSQSGTESERQIGLSLINPRQQLNEILITNKRKNDQTNTLDNNKRTSSTSTNNNNNNESDKEEPQLVNFADANTAMDALNPSQNGDGNQQTVFPLRPRPIKTYTNGFSHLNNPAFSLTSNNNNNQLKPTSNEDDASSIVIPVSKSSLPVKTGEVVSFRTALDNTMASPDHTYENIPNSSQTDMNKTNSDLRMFNENDQQLKSDIYVNTIVDPNADFQQTLESQKGGITLINSQESTQTTTMTSLSSQTIDPQNLSPRPQTALFANRLTNPVFSVDRQLLANTIANQFDLHLNSPYLQKLIENQHLFVSQKRTYANMIWQITADEENALCSSPVRTIPSITDTLRIDSNSSTVKSILKQHKHRAVSKKQRITWDSRVE